MKQKDYGDVGCAIVIGTVLVAGGVGLLCGPGWGFVIAGAVLLCWCIVAVIITVFENNQ